VIYIVTVTRISLANPTTFICIVDAHIVIVSSTAVAFIATFIGIAVVNISTVIDIAVLMEAVSIVVAVFLVTRVDARLHTAATAAVGQINAVGWFTAVVAVGSHGAGAADAFVGQGFCRMNL